MATPCASGLLTVEPCREATSIESSIAAIESAAARSIATQISMSSWQRMFVIVAPSCHQLRRIASQLQTEIFGLFDETDRLVVWTLSSVQRDFSTPFWFAADNQMYEVHFVANETHARALQVGPGMPLELVLSGMPLELVLFDPGRICQKTLAAVEAFCEAEADCDRRAIYVTLSLEKDDEAPTGN